ncbi:hypothetical protein FUA23_16960, partial [Neolewinella aurantiaca]
MDIQLPRMAYGRTLFCGALLCLLALSSATLHAQDFNHPTSGTQTVSLGTGLTFNYYDSGGADCDGTGGEYSADEEGTLTLCPADAGSVITVEFLEVDIESRSSPSCWDFITIYDGNSTASPTLFNGCGEEGFPLCSGFSGDGGNGGGTDNGPDDLDGSNADTPSNNIFTSTDASGCITVFFDSDGTVQEGGWVALVSANAAGCVDAANPVIDDATARPQCDETFTLMTEMDYIYTVDPPSNGTSNSRDCRSGLIWRTPRFSDDCGIDSIAISFSAGSTPAPTQFPATLTYGPGSAEVIAGEADGFVQFITPSQYFYGSGASASTTTTVTYEVFDGEGNVETCSFSIEVVDNEDPIIDTCPADFTANGDETNIADGPGSALAYSETAVTITEAQFTAEGGVIDENCGVETITYVDVQAGMDPIVVTRTFTVTDYAGLSATCEQTITIVDCIVDLTCADLEVFLDETGSFSITPEDVLAPGACDDTNLSLSQSDFECVDALASPVTVTLFRNEGVTGEESCDAAITVSDTLAPAIMQTNFINVSIASSQNPACPCPGSTFLEDNALGQDLLVSDIVDFGATFFPDLAPFFLGIFEDNCTADEDIIVRVTEVNHFPLENGNDSIVVYGVLVDAAGNESIQDTANIILVDDIDPELTCESEVEVLIDDMGNASVTDTSALLLSLSDNCTDSAALVVTLDAPVLGCDGTTGTATLTVADASGNTASCMVGLMPVDEVAPTAVCADVTVELDAMGLGSLDGVGAGTGTAAVVVTGSLDDTDPQFARPNANGTTCTTSVGDDHYYDVLNFTIDSEDMYTISMTPNANGDFFFVLYEGGFDAAAPCDNFLEGDDDASGSLDPELMIQLTLVPGDYSLVTTTFAGGLAVGSYEISISGENGGMAIVEGADDDDDDDATSSNIDGGSTDNCGDVTFSEDITDFTCADIGENVVTLTVTDAAGNTSTCTSTVTVEDNIAPEVTVTDQVIVLNDGNLSQTLTTEDLVTVTDNCGDDDVVIEFDRPLTFDGDDIGTQTITVTVTDANGNEVEVTVTVVVTFDQPNLACIGEINLTLNDECQGLVIPEMVLVGNVGLIDAFPFEIVVNDSDPSNGPIVDGCGEFTYSVSVPTANESVTGFVGSFAGSNWTVTDNANADEQQLASATFTTETLVMSTTGSPFGVGGGTDFELSTSIMFSSSATVSFDYDLNGVDAGFDDVIVVYNFEGAVVTEVVNTDDPATGSSSFDVEAGYTLEFRIEDDGLQPIGDILATVLTISNFSVDGLGSELALDFETCWGIVNAEDKTPPAVVTTPANIDLLCVDLDGNNLATLPTSVSRCYTVDASTGATVPGTMASALRARLLARTTAPVVPTFTDGCSDEIEVCVSDAVAYGDDPDCDDVVITRT